MSVNIFRGIISILGSKIATLVLGLLITPILVRLLGSSQYGDYAFFLSIISISMVLIKSGIFDGVRKYIAEDREIDNWTEYVFGFYFRLALILAIFTSLVYIAISQSDFPKRFFGSDFTIFFVLLVLLITGRQMNSVARAGLMGLGLEEKSEPLNIINQVLFSIFALFLVYTGYGVVGALVAHIISILVVSSLAYIILFQHIDLHSIFMRTPADFPKKELYSFNGLSIILIFLTASLYHVDIIFLRILTGSQSTGHYKAALKVAEFLWFVPNVLQMSFLHSSSELWSNNRIDRIRALASQATRYNLSLVLLLTIGLAALAHDFIPIYYGSDFDAAIQPLLLLLPGALGFALARPIFAIGQGKGQLRILIIATGIASMINLCLNTLLIPFYGMMGAAIATSIGYGSMLILHILAAQKIGFNPIDGLPVIRITVVAAIAALFIFTLSDAISSSIVSLIVVPPVGFVIYSMLSLKFSVVPPEEAVQAAQRLPSPAKNYIEKLIRFIS